MAKAANSIEQYIIHGIQEKKGKSITMLNLTKLKDRVTDTFIIAEAESSTQLKAIADSVIEEVKKASGERPWSVEGLENAQWILLDYVDVVVHLFQPQYREFYGIEELWNDAVRTDIAE
jgi:ribosome-associated protein